MAAAAEVTGILRSSEESVALASQLRKLARVATLIARPASPAAFFWFHHQVGLGWARDRRRAGVVIGSAASSTWSSGA